MRDDARLVLAFSGRTKAGKTTIANSLAGRLNWPLASFGDYVRSEALSRGRTDKREDLQDLGATLITTLGIDEFCRLTLAHADLDNNSAPCIVEGVRHLDALTALRRLFEPVPVYLIHLDISDEERQKRLEAEGVTLDRGAAWEQHDTEQDVAQILPDQAELLVPVGDMPEPALATIIGWLDAS